MCKEEKCEENWAIFKTNILRTTAISFNFDMLSCVYVRQKIYEFGRNQLSSFGDTKGYFMVPVNNTLVCRTSSFVSLAADTPLCVLIKYFTGEIFMDQCYNSYYEWSI